MSNSVLTALLILAWIAIVLLALGLGGLLAQVRHMTSFAPGRPGTGMNAPQIPGAAATKRLILFVTLDCEACRSVLGDLQTGQLAVDKERLLVVIDEPPPTSLQQVPHVVDPETFGKYAITATPYYYSLNLEHRVVEHGVMFGSDHLRQIDARLGELSQEEV